MRYVVRDRVVKTLADIEVRELFIVNDDQASEVYVKLDPSELGADVLTALVRDTLMSCGVELAGRPLGLRIGPDAACAVFNLSAHAVQWFRDTLPVKRCTVAAPAVFEVSNG